MLEFLPLVLAAACALGNLFSLPYALRNRIVRPPSPVVTFCLVAFGLAITSVTWFNLMPELGNSRYAAQVSAVSICMILFWSANPRSAPVVLLALGGLANMTVMLIHGGQMPAETLFTDLKPGYTAMTTDSLWWLLGDWIKLGRVLIAPGDVLMLLGAVLFHIRVAQHAFRRKAERKGGLS